MAPLIWIALLVAALFGVYVGIAINQAYTHPLRRELQRLRVALHESRRAQFVEPGGRATTSAGQPPVQVHVHLSALPQPYPPVIDAHVVEPRRLGTGR